VAGVLSTRSIVAVALLAAQTSPPETAAFGRAPLPKGTRVVATSSNEQDVKSTVKGGGIEQAIDGSTRIELGWNVAVAEADEKETKSASIEVTRAHVHVVSPLVEQDDDVAIAGRSFQATRTSDGWSFAGKDGKDGPAPDDEGLVTLRAIAARTLDPAPIAAVLDGRRLAVGETVELSADDAKRLLATLAEAWTVKTCELKLASIAHADPKAGDAAARLETARFTVTTTLAASGPATAGADATMELTGELVVATARSLVLRASLRGPIKIDGRLGGAQGSADAAATIHGSGEAKWSLSAELR
jgi:hypothetical protein